MFSQIDDADREHNRERYGKHRRDDKFHVAHFADHRGLALTCPGQKTTFARVGELVIEKFSKSGGWKQLVRRLLQMLSGSARAREVPDKLSGQFVYADAP
jgi:hypothetical protein